MFRIRVSKEKVLAFLRSSRALRPLANSRDLLIPLPTIRTAEDTESPKSGKVKVLNGRISMLLRSSYLDIVKDKISFINRVLVLTSILLLSMLILEFAGANRSPGLIMVEEPQRLEAESAPGHQSKPLAYYSREIGKRGLFKQNRGSGTSSASEKPGRSSVTLEKLAENLFLLGLTLDREPQAVIEDQKSQRTYFLRIGEFIGSIKVEAILDGKVILGFEDERLELAF